MDLVKIISELRKERAAIEETLVYLEKLARTSGTLGGRASLMSGIVAPRERKPFSEATKKKMAAAQKRRWAAVRSAENAKNRPAAG